MNEHQFHSFVKQARRHTQRMEDCLEGLEVFMGRRRGKQTRIQPRGWNAGKED